VICIVSKNPTRKIDGALVVYHKGLSFVGNATCRGKFIEETIRRVISTK